MPNVIIDGVSCIELGVPVTPGISNSRPFQLRAAGTLATKSPLNTACRVALCTSTTGVSPATVTVSSSPPTDISLLTVTVPDPLNSMPVRTTVLNPGSVNVSLYVPGRKSTMRYCPVPSVTTERTFSMSAGLAASTVTPGRTAPDGRDCSGDLHSLGGNVGSAKGCGLREPTDRSREDPQLRRLGPNGGPTPTMALRPTSPAIGSGIECSRRDQRGAPRDRRCDAGAYELVRCLGKPVNIVGTPGGDELSGGRGPDVFLGMGGDDEFQGSIGKDRACGGPGNDLLIAGPGDDRFDGEAGNDRVRGESGGDWVWGGAGRDRLVGRPGDDRCQAERRDRDPRGCEILVTAVARRTAT